MVAHLGERMPVPQHAQESLLHGIFGVSGIAQDGIGHAIEGRGVLVDQRRDGGVFRAPARILIHRARGNLHPTCVNGLAGAHHVPDAGRQESAQAVLSPAPDGRVRLRRAASRRVGPQVLLCAQLLRRNLACRAVLIRVPDLGPKRARLILLAFRGVEIGQVKLRHGS